jgi:hypothetical protein
MKPISASFSNSVNDAIIIIIKITDSTTTNINTINTTTTINNDVNGSNDTIY